MHWHAAESADSVHYEESAVRVCHALKFFERLPESGGGLSDGGSENFGLWMLFEGLFERFRLEWFAQFGYEIDDLCASTLGDFHDLATEEAQAARDERIALFEQVGKD